MSQGDGHIAPAQVAPTQIASLPVRVTSVEDAQRLLNRHAAETGREYSREEAEALLEFARDLARGLLASPLFT